LVPGGGVDYTFLTCTYNRAGDLRELLESAVAQDTAGQFTYEVLVADNNSQDNTRAVVDSFRASHPDLVRYVFEARQGKSYALNTALEAALGRVYVIADDDLIYPPDYLRKVDNVLRKYPHVSVVGGKVLPLWRSPPPAWLTDRHWTPLAMMDNGEQVMLTDAKNPVCLLAGAYRRDDVRSISAYRLDLGVSGGRIGGVEDADVMNRLYNAGYKGLYCGNIEVFHKVDPRRATKHYHRAWHRDHGRQYAIMREAKFEAAKLRLLGAPSHLFRAAAADAIRYLQFRLQRKEEDAFWHEARLWFFLGFIGQRVSDLVASKRVS
jgi:glycosyltransferase involved in cell wall biosynthesis